MYLIDPQFATAGFLVGALIGVTGVGGGSLMTPILVLLFGVAPATAVGTDLLFAAATKTVGSFVHGFNRTIEWRIVARLATGSIPATVAALGVLWALNMGTGGARQVITAVLSVTLLLTAVALIARQKIFALYADRLAKLDTHSVGVTTVCVGAILGVLVTFSSVGAGAIGLTALVLLYPRVTMARLVGCDIAHAVPLTLIAGLGHGAMGSVDLHTLLCLLAGSIPGVFAGSSLSARIPDIGLRYVLALVLFLVGAKFAMDMTLHSSPNVAAAVSAPTH
jgi:uncharacterized membrane protein YfcA